MKLLATALALSAGQALAHTDYSVYIPFDCYSEDDNMYGNPDGSKVSDYLTMTGLDAYAHQLSQVTACVNRETGLLSGVTTSWAKWNNGVQSDVKRLNIIGNMSGLYEFNDGVSVSDEADYILQQYWFQEAEPTQEQDYLQFAFENTIGSTTWTADRQALFDAADLNGDGSLNREEGREFLRKARPLDNKTEILDTRFERVDRHYSAALALNGSSSMSLNDYKKLEETMQKWYVDGKLRATGWVKDENDGDQLKHDCSNLDLGENDRIIYSMIESGPEGVVGLALQTVKTNEWYVQGNASRYQYVSKRWRRWADDGIDFAGFMGTTAANGDMNSLGFVLRDSDCSQQFIDALGSSYTWTSPKGAVAVVPERTPEHVIDLENIEVELQELRAGEIEQHDHDEKAESALVGVTIAIWVAVAILIMVFVFQYCREKKGGSSVTRE